MVNVEADVLAGPVLAARARRAGRRLLAGLRRPAGADLRAGRLGAHLRLRGRRRRQGHEVPARLPRGHARHGLGALRPHRRAGAGGRASTPQMFNSFLDGTKSAIEMAAIANATGLDGPRGRPRVPALRRDDLRTLLRSRDWRRLDARAWSRSSRRWSATAQPVDPRPALGRLRRRSRRRTTTPRPASAEYGLPTDSPGRYAALYRPYHLIGLELGDPVARAALARRADRAPPEPGAATSWPWPSATSPPARRSTARAATRSGASSPGGRRAREARCRSASPTASPCPPGRARGIITRDDVGPCPIRAARARGELEASA